DAFDNGCSVLATCKGENHACVKIHADINQSNNCYDVVNIGIKQPISDIISAARDNKADVIGMSGLLVKSTVVMKDNLSTLNSEGIASEFPVLLGGAALTRAFVEIDLADMYQGDVFYARDAFEGLRLMDEVMTSKRTGVPMAESSEAAAKAAERRARGARGERTAARRAAGAEPVVVPERADVAAVQPSAVPPFWGTRIAKGIPVADYVDHLDERALFFGQWGLR